MDKDKETWEETKSLSRGQRTSDGQVRPHENLLRAAADGDDEDVRAAEVFEARGSKNRFYFQSKQTGLEGVCRSEVKKVLEGQTHEDQGAEIGRIGEAVWTSCV